MIIMGMRPVNLIAFVAIAAFDPTAIFGDAKPNTRVAKRAFAAITSNFPFGDNLSFWRCSWHWRDSLD
jgi:hypothetical protein